MQSPSTCLTLSTPHYRPNNCSNIARPMVGGKILQPQTYVPTEGLGNWEIMIGPL